MALRTILTHHADASAGGRAGAERVEVEANGLGGPPSGSPSESEGEQQRPVYGGELVRGQRAEQPRECSAWNGGDRVQIRHALLGKPFGRSEGHFGGYLPDPRGDRSESHQLADGIGFVAREENNRATAGGSGQLYPPDLAPPHLPVFGGEQANGSGLRGLDLAVALGCAAIAGLILPHECRVSLALEPVPEGRLDDGTAALAAGLADTLDR